MAWADEPVESSGFARITRPTGDRITHSRTTESQGHPPIVLFRVRNGMPRARPPNCQSPRHDLARRPGQAIVQEGARMAINCGEAGERAGAAHLQGGPSRPSQLARQCRTRPPPTPPAQARGLTWPSQPPTPPARPGSAHCIARGVPLPPPQGPTQYPNPPLRLPAPRRRNQSPRTLVRTLFTGP